MRSTVNKEYTFDESKWLISILKTEGGSELLGGGHSLIVVEGLLPGQSSFKPKFTGQYDIYGAILMFDRVNKKGVINKIRVFEEPKSQDEINVLEWKEPNPSYSSYPSKSFNVNIADVKAMIKAIKNQKVELDELIQQNTDRLARKENPDYSQYPLYQVVGTNHPLSEKGRGDNCSSWCVNFLNVAGIHDLDDVISKPQSMTSSCPVRTRSSSNSCLVS
jgi:hypothetical protein